MRREQAAALTWGVCLTLAAIITCIATFAVVGYVSYCVGCTLA